MNERIKELAEQAVDYALSVCDANGCYQGAEYLTVVKEKFAELIVRDVVDTVKRTQKTSPDFEWTILNNYSLDVKE